MNINSNLVAIGSGKASKPIKKYPRPWDKDENHIGKGALPVAELEQWFAKKREAHKWRMDQK